MSFTSSFFNYTNTLPSKNLWTFQTEQNPLSHKDTVYYSPLYFHFCFQSTDSFFLPNLFWISLAQACSPSCRMEIFTAMYLVTTKKFSCLMKSIIMGFLPALDYSMLPPSLSKTFFSPTVWWIQHEVPATQLCNDLCITIYLIWLFRVKFFSLTSNIRADHIPDPPSTSTFLIFTKLKFVILPNWLTHS